MLIHVDPCCMSNCGLCGFCGWLHGFRWGFRGPMQHGMRNWMTVQTCFNVAFLCGDMKHQDQSHINSRSWTPNCNAETTYFNKCFSHSACNSLETNHSQDSHLVHVWFKKMYANIWQRLAKHAPVSFEVAQLPAEHRSIGCDK